MRRRTVFASPFVVVAACSSPAKDEPHITRNPPIPDAAPAAAVPDAALPDAVLPDANLPRYGVSNNPPPPHTTWSVHVAGTSCTAVERIACPEPKAGEPRMTCNPPAPIDYPCPKGVTKSVITIEQYGETCTLAAKTVPCPRY